MKKLFVRKEFTILLIILLLSVLVTIINPSFLSLSNFVDVAKGNVVYGVMAFGMLLVLISGGIDLSIPGNITMCSVLFGIMLMQTTWPFELMIVLTIVAGAALGAVNGLLINYLKLPPFVATLGVNSILMGLVLYFTKGNMITGLPKWFQDFGMRKILEIGSFSIPIQVVLYLLALLLTYFILRHTVLGRGVYAVGGNLVNARRVGYNVDWINIFIYIFSGAMVGLSAVVNTSVVQGVNPNTYVGIDMTVISIAVIGGASTMGGVGSVLGTFLGTLLMGLLQNGLIMAKIPTFYQKIIMGAVILAAVTADILSRKREKEKLVHVDVDERETVPMEVRV